MPPEFPEFRGRLNGMDSWQLWGYFYLTGSGKKEGRAISDSALVFWRFNIDLLS